jgi:hypothetical protein
MLHDVIWRVIIRSACLAQPWSEMQLLLALLKGQVQGPEMVMVPARQICLHSKCSAPVCRD